MICGLIFLGWKKVKFNVLIFNEVNNLMVFFYCVYVFCYGFVFFILKILMGLMDLDNLFVINLII